ncbi:MAG: orotate phosphoribosyltransferase [Ferruginibacter sp.]
MTETNEQSVASALLRAGAVNFRPETPYTWASGWKSPIYCDNRRLLSFPFIRDFIKSELCNLVFSRFENAECIAGVATAGIAWGAMVADQLKLPYIYVRPQPKSHGMGNQIEGAWEKGSRVVVMEDLVSTGMSSLKVCKVLEEAGLKVEGMTAIFTYGFKVAEEAFEKEGIQLYSLSNYDVLVAEAIKNGEVDATASNTLLKWLEQPESWGK